MEKFRKKLKKIFHFLQVGIWQINLSRLNNKKKITYSILRITLVVVKEFNKNKFIEKSYALTYLTLLSIVPVIAMLFAIAKGFGVEKLMKKELSLFLGSQEDVLNQVLPLAQNMLNRTSGGIITGISSVFLIYTILRLLENVEITFNDVWNIKKGRNWQRKIADYMAIMLLSPILLIVASSATFFVSDQIQVILEGISIFHQVETGILSLLKFLPYSLIWILFTLVYLIFPNTKVKILPAIIAGVIAGTCYQLTQWAFINLQFTFANYNAIYGSLVILPLLLIWLQISWIIMIVGVKITYSIQNYRILSLNSGDLTLSFSLKKKLSFLILYYVIENFEKNKTYTYLKDIGGKVNIPYRTTQDMCNKLERAKLINKIDTEETGYLPSFDIHKMDFATLIEKFESNGNISEFLTEKSTSYDKINSTLQRFQANLKNSKENILLKDL